MISPEDLRKMAQDIIKQVALHGDAPAVIARVHKIDGTDIWGLLRTEDDRGLTLHLPLPDGQFQICGIPWHRVDSVFIEDEDDPEWQCRVKVTS